MFPLNLPFPLSDLHPAFFRTLVAASLLLGTCAAHTAELAPLSLQEAQRLAVARSTQLEAQDAATLAARDMAVAAGQLPDPVLKLGIDNLPATGPDRLSLGADFMTMRRIGIMQELTRQDKRKLKSQRFEREAEQAQVQRQLALASVQRDTALAWLDSYYAQTLRALLLRQQDETRLQEQAALVAYRDGRGTQADLFAARGSLIEVADRIAELDLQVANASLMLARWTGNATERILSGSPPWKTLVAGAQSDALLSADALRTHPQLQALAVQVEAAQVDAGMAEANTKSDWTIEVAYQQRGQAYSNMVSVGISVPLQWDQKSRQNREIAASLSKVNQARAIYEEKSRAYAAEVRSLYNDWTSSRSRAERYAAELIPVARQRTEATLTAYRSGKGDLASVLVARQNEINAEVQTLTLEQQAARLAAQLDYLVPDPSLDAGFSSRTNTEGAANPIFKGQP